MPFPHPPAPLPQGAATAVPHRSPPAFAPPGFPSLPRPRPRPGPSPGPAGPTWGRLPLALCHLLPPTAGPGPRRLQRSPSAAPSLAPAPTTNSELLKEKRAPAGYHRRARIEVTLAKTAAMLVRGTPGTYPPTAGSRRPRPRRRRPCWCGAPLRMRSSGKAPAANTAPGSHTFAGHQSWEDGPVFTGRAPTCHPCAWP